MNERVLRQQLTDLAARLATVEAKLAALEGAGGIPIPAKPKAAEPKAPSIPRRTKGAKDG